jgi:hypothetical protein
MLPDFLVIGAEKAGTTWLYDRLKRHPTVFMPSVKELHFFNQRNSNLELTDTFEEKDREWYEYHFRNAEEEAAVGEATPMYLCDEHAPERIAKSIPDVKLIACLRHPTDRAYSHYWMAKGKQHTELGFDEVVRRREDRFIERGHYGKQLERYLLHFDRDQLLILIHEELFTQPSTFLNRVCSHLGVDDTFYQDQSWIREKEHASSTERSVIFHQLIGKVATWMRTHEGTRQLLDGLKRVGVAGWIKQVNKQERPYPEMSEEIRAELDEYYADTFRQVEDILGRRVEVWRNQSVSGTP